MLKWTVGTAIMTVIIAIAITWEANGCETQNQASHATANARPLTNPMLVIAIGGANQEKSQNQTSRTSTQPNSYFCRVVTPANIPSIYLVLIGAGGVVVAIGTLGILGSQTEATQKAAEAARLNAQAVIDSERAWLVPAAEFVKPNELPTVGLHNSQVEQITIRIENCGRTPAWLMDWSVEAVVLDDTNIGQYTNAARPEGDFPNARPFPQGRTENIWCEWTTNWTEIAEIKSGQRQLYVYGFLQYRSMVGNEPRISRFCFHYYHRRDSIGGFYEGWEIEPPEENYYT